MANDRQINIESNDYSAIRPFIEARNSRLLNKIRKEENDRLITKIGAWGKWLAIGAVALGLAILLAQSFFRYQRQLVIEKPNSSAVVVVPGTETSVVGGSAGSAGGSGGSSRSGEGGISTSDGSGAGNSGGQTDAGGASPEDGAAGGASNDGQGQDGQPGGKAGSGEARSSDERPAPIIRYVPVPDPNVSKTIEKTIIVEKPIYIPIDVPTREGVKTEFTIFRTVPLPDIQAGVVTGWNFRSSAEKEPFVEYCYLSRHFKAKPSRKFDLARRFGGREVNKYSISDATETDLGLDKNRIESSLKLCEWFKFNRPLPPPASTAPDDSDDTQRAATGSGFFINSDGVLVTNQHVVKGCRRYWIRLNEKLETVELLDASAFDDLAVLKFSGEGRPPPLKIADQLRLGEQVVALGFPLGDRLGTAVKVTTGNVSSLAGAEDDKKYLQFTAPIQPGNSGGPLINEKGLVVGVNTATLVGDKLQNINFAVKTDRLIGFLARQKQYFEVAPGDEKMEVPDLVEKVGSSVVQVLCVGDRG